jgi:hypothetical protein
MFKFFKTHFGMVMSIVIALIVSFVMSATAIIWDKLYIGAVLVAHGPAERGLLELWLKNWGTAFLVIMATNLILPVKAWGDQLAGKIGLKPRTLPFGLVSNIVPTFFFNTFATLVLAGANIGFAAPFYWAAVWADYFVMFGVSYVMSFIAEAIAVKVALANCPPPPHG